MRQRQQLRSRARLSRTSLPTTAHIVPATKPSSTGLAFDRWLSKIEAAPLTALDTETTSLDPFSARIVGISFAVTPGEAAYLPLAHDYAGAPAQLPQNKHWRGSRAGWNRQTTPRSGRISSTMSMCSPITASNWPVSNTIPCCNPTCSNQARRVCADMTSANLHCAILACRPFHSKRFAAKAPARSVSIR